MKIPIFPEHGGNHRQKHSPRQHLCSRAHHLRTWHRHHLRQRRRNRPAHRRHNQRHRPILSIGAPPKFSDRLTSTPTPPSPISSATTSRTVSRCVPKIKISPSAIKPESSPASPPPAPTPRAAPPRTPTRNPPQKSKTLPKIPTPTPGH